MNHHNANTSSKIAGQPPTDANRSGPSRNDSLNRDPRKEGQAPSGSSNSQAPRNDSLNAAPSLLPDKTNLNKALSANSRAKGSGVRKRKSHFTQNRKKHSGATLPIDLLHAHLPASDPDRASSQIAIETIPAGAPGAPSDVQPSGPHHKGGLAHISNEDNNEVKNVETLIDISKIRFPGFNMNRARHKASNEDALPGASGVPTDVDLPEFDLEGALAYIDNEKHDAETWMDFSEMQLPKLDVERALKDVSKEHGSPGATKIRADVQIPNRDLEEALAQVPNDETAAEAAAEASTARPLSKLFESDAERALAVQRLQREYAVVDAGIHDEAEGRAYRDRHVNCLVACAPGAQGDEKCFTYRFRLRRKWAERYLAAMEEGHKALLRGPW